MRHRLIRFFGYRDVLILLKNRLINLVAEDNAIEDTIYHLHRALNTGRIDLERFLRVSRTPRRHPFL